jgi:flagellar basal-body rod protein FlgC
MFDALDISTSGLVAERIRLNAIASNLANAFTTRDAAGAPNPYRRRVPIFRVGMPGGPDGGTGVRVEQVIEDPSPLPLKYMPGHPDANKDGYVRMPNVDLTVEYVDALEATRAYEANVAAMEATKAIMASALRIIA